MKHHLNERGSSLLLALFLVFLVSILSVSLLTISMQGYSNSKKGENSETANYAAESGAAIAMRALKESVAKQKLSLEQAQIDAFISDFNAKPLTFDYKPHLTFGAISGESHAYALTSARSIGNGSLAKEKAVTLRFKIMPNTGGSAGAIFGQAAVSPEDLPKNEHNNSVFVGENGQELSVNKSIPLSEYKNLFMDYYDGKMGTRPLSASPLQPSSPSFGSDPLTPGDYAIATSPHASSKYSGTVSSSANSLVINGDVYAGGDFIFGGNELVINGNLIVGGNIKFNGYLNNLKITGNVTAGKAIGFNGTGIAEIGGTVSSGDAIMFNDINDSAKGLSVGGSIIAGKEISFKTLNKLHVAGTVSSKMNIVFSRNISDGFVGDSIVSGGAISFVSSVAKLRIGRNISGIGSIDFSENISELTLENGSITSGSSISFKTINQMNVSGSISAEQHVSFAGNISNANLSGSIFALGSLQFSGINKLAVGDSILAGSRNNSSGVHFGNGYMGELFVGGTILSPNKIDFAPINTNLTVKSFVGSIGKITWNNLNRGAGTARIGGITSGAKIELTPGWKEPGGVVLAYSPPDGSGGEEPVIEFGGWTAK